jgi:hypothetical protein
MGLDLTQAAAALDAAAPHIRARAASDEQAALLVAGALAAADPAAMEARRRAAHTTFLVAGLLEEAIGASAPPPAPDDHAVIAVDGSHIDVDRASPARLALVNLGTVVLRYGAQPDAALSSQARLLSTDDDLALRAPDGTRESPVEGPVLGMLRAVMEAEALASAVEALPAGLPALALLDGSLILWGLAGAAQPDHVRRALLDERLLPALERLRAASARRPLAVVSHVSAPRSTDVVNAARLAPGLCPHTPVNCDARCGALARGKRPCDGVGTLTDAGLFARTLAPGERSPLYASASSVMEAYGEHAVRFCYVHLGEEVARLEVPGWTDVEALGLAHALVLQQAAKGHGYPVALQEAHEQAVINGADRRAFGALVEELFGRGAVGEAQKARSKRTRWV